MLATLAMFGFGYALVPLYNVFCDITGLNGKTNSEAAIVADTSVDTSRLVTVEFLANVNANLPWEFKPVVTKLQVHPGETKKLSYYARNLSDNTIVANAVPSVAPGQAAKHFQKTECFCFTQQALKPGEEREMPVVFIVDKALPDNITTLTLSYTFFNSPKAAQQENNMSLSAANR